MQQENGVELVRSDGGLPNILIVDDRPENHRVIKRILHEVKATFHYAHSGKEGLSMALREKYAVILLDVMMPDMDGFETASLLRCNESTRHVPLIFITAADPSKELEFKGYEVGAVDYLFKPINAHSLRSKIQVFLELEDQRSRLQRTLGDVQRLESKNRLLLESIGEGILGVDAQGRITYTNPACEKLLGLPEAQLSGRGIQEFVNLSHHQEEHIAWQDSQVFKRCNAGLTFHEEFGLFYNKEKQVFPVKYLANPIHDGNRMVGVVIAFQDITQRRKIEEQLSRLAQFDTLTGLLNRGTFEKHLHRAIERADSNRRGFSLLHLDIDHFRQVNDQFGHDVGDLLLQEVSHRVCRLIRDGDLIGRLGGDEFIILLESFTEHHNRNAAQLAERIIDVLSEAFKIHGHEFFIGASIGIATFPESGELFEPLLQAAELAMFKAKSSGRQNFQFFTEELQQQALAAMELERNLRRALAQQEFELYYQPKLELGSGRILGCEALVRWKPDGNMTIGPDTFIPKLEEMGRIGQLGDWIIDQVCRQLKHWRDEHGLSLCVAVNLSVKQLQQEALPEQVGLLLDQYELPRDCIEFEITESMMMHDPESAVATLSAFQFLGIAVSVDDFGTGYSSFGYLQHLPLDALKIDRLFIQRLFQEEKSAEIVRAIISLAHNLNLKVIAEGVETQQQLAFLQDEGCDFAQGYLISRPVPAEEMTQLLLGHRDGKQ
ncbi:two-component system response regulator [Marinobacterium zhoushanense]|uniref:Two-component system response regulator n=1 Tax=Marinobacterium zhoushanense TaxID=1679163 RepID=A0ABQ1KQS1_9GAMM|nr:EAL domain-containing protein [Marinobacterium zhoushanense]GGC04885.1 two-component system response regulator [Marinobacterium zhoushanense]